MLWLHQNSFKAFKSFAYESVTPPISVIQPVTLDLHSLAAVSQLASKMQEKMEVEEGTFAMATTWLITLAACMRGHYLPFSCLHW